MVTFLVSSSEPNYEAVETKGFSGGAAIKILPAIAGGARDSGSIPESGRSPGVGNDNLLQYSYLKNPMDRIAYQVHGVTKS